MASASDRQGPARASGAAAIARLKYARVALDVPIAPWFDYQVPADLEERIGRGDWVLVPWGRGRKVGIVLGFADAPEIAADKVRPIAGRIDEAPPAPPAWLELGEFAARYYHRHPGEVMLPAIPRLLRTPPGSRQRKQSAFERARRRFVAPGDAGARATRRPPSPEAAMIPDLRPAQAEALAALEGAGGFGVFLLHGVTGSGKTEVYLRFIADRLATDPAARVLVLVPEIALTPQLSERIRARFPGEPIAILHSGLAEGERAANWLAVADGRARILVGTRLAVLAPIPGLAGIVVDEEHDPSYKQQEGVHYSARDLAVMLASQRRIPVVLGSATPSAETWQAARAGRYRLLSMPERASGMPAPRIEILAIGREMPPDGLAGPAREAIAEVLADQGQAMVFLNRRGYAPVLACGQCGWLSRCDDCTAYRVLHRGTPTAGRFRLVCHHCGGEQAVPRSCPDCGDADLRPLGRGTQRLEEALAQSFPDARIARLDRDVARRRGAAEAMLDAVHGGEVDLLVGTQMLAKGHDFQRLRLVVVADPDGALFAADFRAPERLFATLVQVAGRAGRFARDGRVLVQTRFPGEPLFADLLAHDFAGFADRLLAERRDAGLPPFSHQALLRAEAVTVDDALGFAGAARDALLEILGATPELAAGVRCFDPVPMPLARLAGRDRAQLLVESGSRPLLHRALSSWLPRLDSRSGRARWQLEIDPVEI
ncbi:MAG: primosomal protein N' [Burkholderiaceae bacterium]